MREISCDYCNQIEYAVWMLNGMAESLMQIGEAKRSKDDHDMFMFFSQTCRSISESIDLKNT